MKQKVARFVFEKCFHWHITTDFPKVKKSIIVVAPHTSVWDAILGKLVLLSYGLNHRILSKDNLFRFPFGHVMRQFGSIPVGGQNRRTAHKLIDLMMENEEMHLVVCPEGTRQATDKWNFGFYTIARLTKVPVFAVYIDYSGKEIGVKGAVSTNSRNEAISDLIHYYQTVIAKHPKEFVLPSISNKQNKTIDE